MLLRLNAIVLFISCLLSVQRGRCVFAPSGGIMPLCHPGCRCSTAEMQCVGVPLTGMPTIYNSNVRVLELSGNGITFLPRRLPPLGSLERLHVSGNDLEGVPSSFLSQTPSLRVFDLSYNRLRHVGDFNVLKPCPSLRVLNVSGNPVRTLEDVLLESDGLEVWDASECNISFISGETLVTYLPNLKELLLAGNPLKRINAPKSPSLFHLNVASCQLALFKPHALSWASSLTHLNVSYNSHLSLLCGSDTLVTLDATGCALQELEANFPLLTVLKLSNNMLSRVPTSTLTASPYLTTLELGGNRIGALGPNSFSGGGRLLSLDLSFNRLASYAPGYFDALESLVRLDLSANPLTYLLELNLKNLKVLRAAHCDIYTISPSLFHGLPRLEYFNISRNTIEVLPHGLGSNSLKTFDVSFNRLSSLPVMDFPVLGHLNLSGNRLTGDLEIGYLPRAELMLSDNPWDCRCGETGFAALYTAAGKRSPDFDDLTCRGPDNVTGSSWKEACFRARDRHAIPRYFRDRPWVPLAISFASMALVLLVLVCVKRRLDRATAPVPPPPVLQEGTATTASPRQEQLPSYEEALLLPKLRLEPQRVPAEPPPLYTPA